MQKGDFPTLTAMVQSLPVDYQVPAIATASLATYLFTTTKFGTDFSSLKKIGVACNHFLDKLDDAFIAPLRAVFRNAASNERNLIGKTLSICGDMRNFVLKVKSACKAFMKVMQRDAETPRSAQQMLGQMDDQQIMDIAKLSRHELAKLHAEAKHRFRDSEDSPAP